MCVFPKEKTNIEKFFSGRTTNRGRTKTTLNTNIIISTKKLQEPLETQEK